MADDKIRIHGGRIVSPPGPSSPQAAPDHTSEEAIPVHQPGQTFHPDGSRPASVGDTTTSERTVSDLVHPQAANRGPELDLTTRPHKQPLSPQAKAEVAQATGMDQLVATPKETLPQPPVASPPAEPAVAPQPVEQPKAVETVAPHEDKPQETYSYEPLKISKPKKSLGRIISKGLLWLLISAVVIVAGAIAVFYFYKP